MYKQTYVMEAEMKNVSETVTIPFKNTDKNVEKSHQEMQIVWHSCDQCTYKAKRKGNLKTHVESIHEGLCYSCDHCGYRSTRKDSLACHVKSEHEGICYSCDKCDYKSSWKSALNEHIESKHEGVSYSCDPVSYTHLTLPTKRIV